MRKQPRVLGCRHVRRQSRQVREDVVLGRNLQGHANRRKIMHGDREGAVHVKHPMLDVRQAHAQSLRWRIKPSWVTEATSCPARLYTLPREKPRELPAHGLSMAYSNQSSARRSAWNHSAWSRLATCMS